MPIDMTLTEFAAAVRTLADPAHECGCAPVGVLAPMLPGGDDSHLFVERCDDCRMVDDDDAAAARVATLLGLSVRRRYDDDTLQYWRPFVARPGSPDDRDTYAVGANEFGCFPLAERPVPPTTTTTGDRT